MNILLSPSEIIEYLYCPRFIYFMFCLCIDQNEHKRFKVQKGREIHKEKALMNKDYLRKKIGMIAKEIDVYLSSDKHHLRGIVDEVLTLQDGTMAPLDYKFAEYREKNYQTYKMQALAYAMLISDNYNVSVNRAFIVYTRSRNQLVEIEFSNKDYEAFNKLVKKILLIIQKGFYPKRTSSRARCEDCTYKNICV